jgi:hypothetical protein
MNELREIVLDTGPRSFAVLGVAATALILGVVACVLGHRRRSWTGLPGHFALAAGSLVLLASGFVVAAVQGWRSVVIFQLLQSTRAAEGDADAERAVILGTSVQFAGFVFIGALVLLALIVASLGLALSWRTEAMRGHRSLAMSRLRAVALLLPAWPAAAGLLLYGLRLNDGYTAVTYVEPFKKTTELLRSIDGAYPIIEAARVALLVLVGLGAIATVVVSRRAARRPVSSARLAASVLIFLAGLFAFTSTRRQAADRRPLPILPNVVDAAYANKMPSISPCLSGEPAPALEFTSDLVRLNGTPADADDEFRDHLLVFRIQYPLLHAGRQMPFLIVEAEPAASTNRIIPYLQKLTEDTTILVASATSHPVLSKTLGTIARYQFCGRMIRLTFRETATPLSRYRSWSDVAAAINRSSEVLEVTPW